MWDLDVGHFASWQLDIQIQAEIHGPTNLLAIQTMQPTCEEAPKYFLNSRKLHSPSIHLDSFQILSVNV